MIREHKQEEKKVKENKWIRAEYEENTKKGKMLKISN